MSLPIFSIQIMPADVHERVSKTFIDDGKEVQLGEYETGITVDKSNHERIYVWEKVHCTIMVWWRPWIAKRIPGTR